MQKLFAPWLHITTEDDTISTFPVPRSLTLVQGKVQASVPEALSGGGDSKRCFAHSDLLIRWGFFLSGLFYYSRNVMCCMYHRVPRLNQRWKTRL